MTDSPSTPQNLDPHSPQATPTPLHHHFSPDPTGTTHPQKWSSLWSSNTTPWDRSAPSPALIDLLSPTHPSHHFLGCPLHANGKRKKALVPGCGRGYDVYLLASRGYDCTGVDVSEMAVERAGEVGGGEEVVGGEGVYKVAKVGRGKARFVVGDFFGGKEGWRDGEGRGVEEGCGRKVGGWDLIYDYTFLCALPPPLRPTWSRRISSLLSPTGILICLEFPTQKDPALGGPPWACPPELHLALLSRPGEEVGYDGEGRVVVEEEEEGRKSEKALTRVAHWRPERTHQVGEGTDWVSIWAKE
ncbi:S-adenosyl-L-methionine-dependent methyltransferase [Aulographum hederae CBS 113979]|uniref:S-adenosyl-L-methionine-dependent methyltransferase n=1 Tax=Aulographum hederae CBS 113979 TaxID=1176131 RepID=A0A6G1GP73_9PEZI|nr:S-adenosyl-L-methionine-dependent methyltransferase [Aulographum hederae CBS 113979]